MADIQNIHPAQDPSPNVLILIEKTIDHFEKMQDMAQKFNDDKLAAIVKKLDDDRITAVDASRRERAEEAKRIDARWLSDTNNVAVANDRAIKQAELLNSQMLDNAEVLRKSVESTATTIATQLEKMTNQQNERIAALERINSENTGRSSAPSAFMARIDELERTQSENSGSSKGKNQMWILITGGIMFLMGIATFIISLVD